VVVVVVVVAVFTTTVDDDDDDDDDDDVMHNHDGITLVRRPTNHPVDSECSRLHRPRVSLEYCHCCFVLARESRIFVGIASRCLTQSRACSDWEAYRLLVSQDVTCFEPEARGPPPFSTSNRGHL
jgi:hypothetical protein